MSNSSEANNLSISSFTSHALQAFCDTSLSQRLSIEIERVLGSQDDPIDEQVADTC